MEKQTATFELKTKLTDKQLMAVLESMQSEIDTLKAQVKTLQSTSRGGGH